MFSKEFVNFAQGIQPQPAKKETRSADLIDELKAALARAAGPGFQAKSKQAAIAGLRIRYKSRIVDAERTDAIQLLFQMSPAKIKQVLDDYDRLKKLADEYGVPPAELLDWVS